MCVERTFRMLDRKISSVSLIHDYFSSCVLIDNEMEANSKGIFIGLNYLPLLRPNKRNPRRIFKLKIGDFRKSSNRLQNEAELK